MKLSPHTIDWLKDKKDRMRKDIQLYKYICVHEWARSQVVFMWFLKQLTSSGAFQKHGNHYKLADHNILCNFLKKLW